MSNKELHDKTLGRCTLVLSDIILATCDDEEYEKVEEVINCLLSEHSKHMPAYTKLRILSKSTSYYTIQAS